MNELSDAQCPFVLYHWGKEVQEMKYLKVFTDFLDVVEPLGDSAAGRLFKAMLRYAMDGTAPVLKGKEGVAWTVARQHMDREAEVYEKKVKHLKRGNVPVTEKKGSVSEQDKDKEKDKDKDKDKDKYIYMGGKPPEAPAPKAHIYIQPPSLEEIRSYCQERGNQVDPEYFYHYYQSNGWRVGKNPMRDWKAAVCAWETNGMAQKMAPARKPDFLDNFRGAMELLNMEEAKQV